VRYFVTFFENHLLTTLFVEKSNAPVRVYAPITKLYIAGKQN
jgi:hypothetical protein